MQVEIRKAIKIVQAIENDEQVSYFDIRWLLGFLYKMETQDKINMRNKLLENR